MHCRSYPGIGHLVCVQEASGTVQDVYKRQSLTPQSAISNAASCGSLHPVSTSISASLAFRIWIRCV